MRVYRRTVIRSLFFCTKNVLTTAAYFVIVMFVVVTRNANCATIIKFGKLKMKRPNKQNSHVCILM